MSRAAAFASQFAGVVVGTILGLAYRWWLARQREPFHPSQRAE